jgi:hypothetical protein
MHELVNAIIGFKDKGILTVLPAEPRSEVFKGENFSKVKENKTKL